MADFEEGTLRKRNPNIPGSSSASEQLIDDRHDLLGGHYETNVWGLK